MKIFKINNKKIRAEVIKEFLGDRRAFAFSCGNVTRWLKRAGVNIIPIDGEALEAKRKITAEEADNWFKAFNATSGYLPTFLMDKIARRIEIENEELRNEPRIAVPFGSGELITTLGFFIPFKNIVAIYSDGFPPTKQDGTSPLARFVARNCETRRAEGATGIEDLRNFAERLGASAFIDTSESEK